MSSKKALLGTSILAGVLTLAAMPALAQTAAPGTATAQDQEETEVEEIVVTGSRLRRETFESPTPVVQVGEEEFERTAVGNAIDVLNEINLVGAGSTSQGANGQFGDNFSFVDLFDLGTQRTLTLVNGRRFISGNQATVFVPDNATGAQVDISAIPPSLIERVEVTPGTGGAIYGADAVGGVVNFILKDDFEGLDVLAQYGVTEYGDGQRYRGAVTWGTNFYDDRANVTLALDYYKQEAIPVGGDRDYNSNIGLITNPRNGGIRNTNFSVANFLNGTQTSAFLPATADFQSSTFLAPGRIRTNAQSWGGFITNGNLLPSGVGAANFFIPSTPVAATFNRPGPAGTPPGTTFFAPNAAPSAANAPGIIAFYAPGTSLVGLSTAQQQSLALQLLQANRPTPAEYYAQNPNLDPLLFVGTLFGAQGTSVGSPLGYFPTIANTDPATSALFPRRAVPLQFNSAGQLVPYNIGDPVLGTIGTGINSDGSSGVERGYGNLLSSTERFSLSGLTRFDITDSITYRGEYLYTDIQYRSIANVDGNNVTGSTTAGSRSIPLFFNQNPYVDTATRAQLQALHAQQPTQQTIGGQPVFFINRALADVYGGPVQSGNDVELFRTAHSLEGEFGLWGRRFYWDAAYVYGQNDIQNIGENIYDIEFALATDVVQGPNGPVCRQQTLAAPESIAIRNPALGAGLNTTLSLVPTAAQVAACVPFNVLGEGNSTVNDALRNYLIADTGSFNEARQHYLQASLGGEIFRLPAGWISAGAQIEWRNESLVFTPGDAFRTGAARNTTGQGSQGELRFLEYGYEVSIPIFSDEWNIPLFKTLELNGAYRIVDRDQETQQAGFTQSPGTTDEVYQAGIRWELTEDFEVRANKSTSVRSASIVELFGAPSTGFGGGTIPCTPTLIDSGPNPTVRRANCEAAVVATGAAPNLAAARTFLQTWVPARAAGVPAATASNPFLANEQADSYGYGFTLTPRWIPRLTIAGDYFATDITGLVGLVAPPTTINACFDQADFPNSSLSGTPACNLFTINVLNTATGNYINPLTNPLTGGPVLPVTNPGGPSVDNAPFNFAFIFYPNFNLAAVQLRATTLEVRYNFGLEELFGSRADNWGDIFLSGSMYNLLDYNTYPNGLSGPVDPSAGERPEFEFRFDVAHRVGPFDQRLTWFRNSATVGNVQTNPATYPEQSLTFETPALNLFNYTAGYEINDRVGVRMTINNLFNSKGPYEEYGVVSDPVGRTFLFTLTGSF